MANYAISTCDDGGHYYIASFEAVGEDRVIVWVGAKDDGSFCNVMWGQFIRNRQLNDLFQGEWWDVPFGNARSNGNIEVRIGTFGSNIVSSTGGFGGTEWSGLQGRREHVNIDHSLPLREGNKSIDGLTGYWKSVNSGAHYYIRQEGNTVVWFAAREDRAAANVFKGKIRNNILTGEWIDVPLGRTRGRGRVSFNILNVDGVAIALRRTGNSSGYGTSLIGRIE